MTINLSQVMSFNLSDIMLVTVMSLIVTAILIWLIVSKKGLGEDLASSTGRWSLVGLLVLAVFGKYVPIPEFLVIPLNWIISILVYPVAIVSGTYAVYKGAI